MEDTIREKRNEMDAILSYLHMHANLGEIRQFEDGLRDIERFIMGLVVENALMREELAK